MTTNVLEYLELSAQKYPDKVAFVDQEVSLTFTKLKDICQSIGSHLIREGHVKKPVVVWMKRSPYFVAACFGVVYSGGIYIPIDSEMSLHRIGQILQKVNPVAIVADDDAFDDALNLVSGIPVYRFEYLSNAPIEDKVIAKIRRRAIDTDPLYVVFTSGSTGTPKGVVVSHKAVIDYTEQLCSALEFDKDCVFGNQAPLYLDACLKDIMPTLKLGAKTHILPKVLLAFPVKGIQYLNDNKVNTLCWVVSALLQWIHTDVFSVVKPEHLKTIAFGGELFPLGKLKQLKNELSNVNFYNLYGPTEATGMSCYYKVPNEIETLEILPIGKPFKNTSVFLLDEAGHLSDKGEIYIKGTCLALGYYNDFEGTQQCFVQNPLHQNHHERVYKTGDYAFYNSEGLLIHSGRRDHQVKHRGYRIELGEIETIVLEQEGVENAIAFRDDASELLVVLYQGTITQRALKSALSLQLPQYSIPDRIVAMALWFLTDSGKSDRLKLREVYLEGHSS